MDTVHPERSSIAAPPSVQRLAVPHVRPRAVFAHDDVARAGNGPAEAARILIVEDDYLVASEMEAALAQAGFEIAGPAASAEEALQLAAGQHPALVVMDIRARWTARRHRYRPGAIRHPGHPLRLRDGASQSRCPRARAPCQSAGMAAQAVYDAVSRGSRQTGAGRPARRNDLKPAGASPLASQLRSDAIPSDEVRRRARAAACAVRGRCLSTRSPAPAGRDGIRQTDRAIRAAPL